MTIFSFQISSLQDTFRVETQRRTGGQEELTASIPEDVLGVLTEGDENERSKQQSVVSSHERFVENTHKFVAKLREEEKQHQQRLSQSHDALNPNATEIANLRHQQARARIQSDFKDQMLRYNKLLSITH